MCIIQIYIYYIILYYIKLRYSDKNKRTDHNFCCHSNMGSERVKKRSWWLSIPNIYIPSFPADPTSIVESWRSLESQGDSISWAKISIDSTRPDTVHGYVTDLARRIIHHHRAG